MSDNQLVKVNRALISVSDKAGIVQFARALQDNPGYQRQRGVFNRLESASDQLEYLQQLTGSFPNQGHSDKELAA